MKAALLFNLPFATLVLLAIVTAQVAQTAPVPVRNGISPSVVSRDAGHISSGALHHDEPTCPKTGCIGHSKAKPSGQAQTAEQPKPEGQSHP
ncbi:hypothetical protein CF327_g7525 [Tilletia walkeri]|uniref:Secreted protein n=1 Tax=Tilletia walkeri TaxID=117179 RepID=A0A8X7T1J7_9BASI|nr:hypothetical protein CF327_g7525 [Tilletia walkeri]KAE8262061.1 hypothetical protein A4X09_0g7542 [Tilletia walkeri]